ncbi:MAG: DNA mismatch repair protein MutS [Planctomycetota bacterium]|nr:DNA mismatch repair protein MutS [Planctomycetota bacterium]
MPEGTAGRSPHQTYTQRLQRWADERARTAARERQLSNGRLAVFAVGGIFSLWIMYSQPSWWPALLLPIASFAATVLLHHKAHSQAVRARALHELYQRAVHRVTDSWAGEGPQGEKHLADERNFGRDIDLFGEGSLFQRLASTPSSMGHDVLAAWLTHPSDQAAIVGRQQAVAELAPFLELREQLAVVSDNENADLDPEKLIAWGQNTSTLHQADAVRAISWTLGLLGVATAAAWVLDMASVGPLGLVVIADLLFGRIVAFRRKSMPATQSAPARQLEGLAALLELIESHQFSASVLVDLRESLRTEEIMPSKHIRSLTKLTDDLGAARHNAFYALFAFLTQKPIRTALDLDAWRTQHGPHVATWLDAAGRFEALLSLGVYAYERPEDVFPEVTDGAPCYAAVGLGHPLIPDAQCVRNDVRLDNSMRLLLLSGSNMSGKSTLLRAVGTNLALAMAGAPVKATALKLTPLALGASIRIEDSLRDGTSHFYAEVKRLKQIDELIEGQWPVIYLLDEILHGTNSSDRLAGSSAIVKKFADCGALGIVTTHDLALARIAEDLGSLARNAHFEDSLVNGEMSFDYTLHEGVVTRGNALALMRSLGLKA